MVAWFCVVEVACAFVGTHLPKPFDWSSLVPWNWGNGLPAGLVGKFGSAWSALQAVDAFVSLVACAFATAETHLPNAFLSFAFFPYVLPNVAVPSDVRCARHVSAGF